MPRLPETFAGFSKGRRRNWHHRAHQHFALRAKWGHDPSKAVLPFFWADEKWANGTAQHYFLPFLQCMTNERFPSQSAVVLKRDRFSSGRRARKRPDADLWLKQKQRQSLQETQFSLLYDIFSSGVRELGGEIQVHPIGEGGSLWFAGPGWKCDEFSWDKLKKYEIENLQDALKISANHGFASGTRRVRLRTPSCQLKYFNWGFLQEATTQNPQRNESTNGKISRGGPIKGNDWFSPPNAPYFYCALISKIRSYTPVI